MENEILNYEELQDYYDMFAVTNGQEYWVYLILEQIIQNFTKEQINNMQLTKEKLDDMGEQIMCDDALWEGIDYTIADVVGKNIKGE